MRQRRARCGPRFAVRLCEAAVGWVALGWWVRLFHPTAWLQVLAGLFVGAFTLGLVPELGAAFVLMALLVAYALRWRP